MLVERNTCDPPPWSLLIFYSVQSCCLHSIFAYLLMILLNLTVNWKGFYRNPNSCSTWPQLLHCFFSVLVVFLRASRNTLKAIHQQFYLSDLFLHPTVMLEFDVIPGKGLRCEFLEFQLGKCFLLSAIVSTFFTVSLRHGSVRGDQNTAKTCYKSNRLSLQPRWTWGKGILVCVTSEKFNFLLF